MKRNLKPIFAGVVIISLFIGCGLLRTVHSIFMFQRLCSAVAHRDFTSARSLVAPDALRFDDSSAIYQVDSSSATYQESYDVTRELSEARPLFWKTFDFYVTDRDALHGGKVRFETPWIENRDGSKHREDTAVWITNGRFTRFKLSGAERLTAHD
jgi:hypothetical protein